MDISKYNKADVLAALFNNAQTQGMGILHHKPDHVMDSAEAEGLLKQTDRFDYLEGRVLKVNLGSDELSTRLYNRDNGPDAAERVIKKLDSVS